MERGLSQQQLADTASGPGGKIDIRRIQLIEAGSHNLSFSVAMRVAQALGTTLRDIWGKSAAIFKEDSNPALDDLLDLIATGDQSALERAAWAIKAALKDAKPKRKIQPGAG